MSGLDYSDCDVGTPWSARSCCHAPCSVVRTRNRAGAGYACSARPDLHTVCRSFPKICDGARRGPWACTGGGRAARPGMFAAYAAWSAREIELQALATLATLAQISTPSAAHFLKSHQLLVQKFAADRDRQRSSFKPWVVRGGSRPRRLRSRLVGFVRHAVRQLAGDHRAAQSRGE